MYYRMNSIISKLEDSINSNSPFSVIKIGDGEIKVFGMQINNEISEWKCEQQGLKKDLNFIKRINTSIVEAANDADFVSGFGDSIDS